MRTHQWQERIDISDEIHHGTPCVKGTRIPVKTIVGSLADGMSFDEILDEYPPLTRNDINAALAYAADVLHDEILGPISA